MDWQQSEDQILLKGVEKYGLNNWDKVSSLLAKRSTKDVRARYYSYLDPNTGTEWTLEDDDRLLRLYETLPAQFENISALMRKTKQQCAERYELLTSGDSQGPLMSRITAARESLPAVPDPIDLDEDMKEQRATAEARMSQDNGRKAKRKERERTEAAQNKVRAIEDARRTGKPLPVLKQTYANVLDSVDDESSDSDVVVSSQRRVEGPSSSSKPASQEAESHISSSAPVVDIDSSSESESDPTAHVEIDPSELPETYTGRTSEETPKRIRDQLESLDDLENGDAASPPPPHPKSLRDLLQDFLPFVKFPTLASQLKNKAKPVESPVESPIELPVEQVKSVSNSEKKLTTDYTAGKADTPKKMRRSQISILLSEDEPQADDGWLASFQSM